MMRNNHIWNKLRSVPGHIWILGVILLIGVFLRTYNFHEWLRFNNDQARDARVVSDVVTGKSGWPLLGPKAGGTEFKLGPIFYYFEIISAKIFGNAPDKMAYPDLISGILAIPLVFFIFRKYLSTFIALILAFILAISYYGVHYGRFAWNPNSMPFWALVFVFASVKIFDAKAKKKYAWAILTGAAFGVAVQLHTLLLVILPIYAVAIFVYAIYRKIPVKKYFVVILAVAFLLNIPQVIDLYHTGGSNVNAFFAAQKIKRSGNSSMFESAGIALSCTFQADLQIVSGLGDPDSCTFFTLPYGDMAQVAGSLVCIAIGLGLTVGGMALLWKKIESETDMNKKNFWIFSAIYGMLYFLIMIPIAHEIVNKAMRYYLGDVFFAFILLGLCLEFIHRRSDNKSPVLSAVILVTAFFTATNISAIRKDFSIFTSTDKGNVSIFTLGEGERMANYILNRMDNSHVAVIDGNSKDMFHFFRPLQFLAGERGLELRRYKSKDYNHSMKLFLVNFGKNENVGRDQQIGRFTIVDQNGAARGN